MNLIETTTTYDQPEDAADALAGIKTIKGYIFGYVRLPENPTQQPQLITIFDCAGGTASTGQRQILIAN